MPIYNMTHVQGTYKRGRIFWVRFEIAALSQKHPQWFTNDDNCLLWWLSLSLKLLVYILNRFYFFLDSAIRCVKQFKLCSNIPLSVWYVLKAFPPVPSLLGTINQCVLKDTLQMMIMRNVIETFTQVKGQEQTVGRYSQDILPARCHVYEQFYNLERIKGNSDQLPQTRLRLFCSLWGFSLRRALCLCGLLIRRD